MDKVNETLAVIERHLEQGNRKVNRVLSAEIQSRYVHMPPVLTMFWQGSSFRRLNEKALLSRLGEIEDRLNGHVGDIRTALDDVKRGHKVEPPPPVDTAAVCPEN